MLRKESFFWLLQTMPSRWKPPPLLQTPLQGINKLPRCSSLFPPSLRSTTHEKKYIKHLLPLNKNGGYWA
ncbi:hypothetical protein JTE90_011758 [Oedothorax gibbosus]|uniref:Uncharacterized protein n=1 Tax=Oedothorax gibbosus TaxID=931172 RepID=A0AAV6VRP1_9ARAC|nr:hypothetical protein JTE90_011758 [Oedothorax gibbosus]